MNIKRLTKSPVALLLKLILLLVSLAFIDDLVAKELQTARPQDHRLFVEGKFSYDSNEHYDILIIGDSHAADAFVPKVIEQRLGVRAFNMAVYGAGPRETYFLVEDLLKRGNFPKYAILGTSPRMFVQPVTDTGYMHLFIRDLFLKWQMLNVTFESKNIRVISQIGIDQGLVKSFVERMFGRNLNENLGRAVIGIDNGYLENVKCIEHSVGAESIIPISLYESSKLVPKQQDFFEKTVLLLQGNGVKVFIANPPLFPGSLKVVRSTKVFIEFMDTISEIATKYGIPVFNSHIDSYENDFQYSQFLNSDHLCNLGASSYTLDFAEWFEEVNISWRFK